MSTTLHIYATIISTLLIALETGGPPSKYDYALLATAASGLSDWDEALTAAARRRAECARAAAWQKAYYVRRKITR